MQTKRFVAADMRRALSLVRDDLGEDAMILSTQRISKGVEIIASAEESVLTPHINKSEKEPTKPLEIANKSEQQQTATVGLASGKTQAELAEELEQARTHMLSLKQANTDNMTLTEWANQQEPAKNNQAFTKHPETNNNPQDFSGKLIDNVNKHNQIQEKNITELKNVQLEQNAKASHDIQRLHEEVINMRNVFENHLLAMSETQERQFNDTRERHEVIPIAALVKQKLSELGLTQACNDNVIRSLRMVEDDNLDEDSLLKESLAKLSKKIPAINNDPVATGGVYAFLGTTGVGKTTTIAKLAARYVIEHGAKEVALITTDTLRIGASEQLRSFGRILNVSVKVVSDLSELPSIIKSVSKQSLVLIDTPGMSFDDPLLKKHLYALKQCDHVQSGLVLSANSQYQIMQASLHNYRAANLRFCVMTKLDECANLGCAISLLATNDLALAYVTNGQSVPSDIAVLKPHQLVSKAVSLSHLNRGSELPSSSVNL